MARWLHSWWAAAGCLWLLALAGALTSAGDGVRRLPRFADIGPDGLAGAGLPLLSVIIAARNEAGAIADSVRSLLGCDYERLEIVAVDDRSADATGAILDALALEDPRLRVIHVKHLPVGWLGKNHAMWCGADLARGTWLLFTDADVRFSSTALRRAVRFAERQGFDHITAAPALEARGLWMRLFVAEFSLAFTLWQRPWHACRPDRRAAVGVGAFNLVRAAAYRRTGGYAAFPLAVADDIALGRVLKAAGFRQTLLVAGGDDVATDARGAQPFLQLQWYPTMADAVRGLEKNAFAMFGFRSASVAFWTAAGTAIALVPIGCALVAPGWHRLPWVLSFALAAGSFGFAGRQTLGRFPWPLILLQPLAQLILAWTVARSAALTMARGGIRWRDTFYPLAQLRGAQVAPPPIRRLTPRLAGAAVLWPSGEEATAEPRTP